MINTVFILVMTLALTGMIYLGFWILPAERWQMFGAIPLRKNSNGTWQGLNITWYGILNGLSYTLATALVLLLLGSIRLPLTVTLFLVFAVLGLCIPASSIVARIVEKKKHTFSVGGAAFVGILATPWIALVSIRLLAPPDTAVMPVLAAISIAYALGEGTGRLACISFGCCYGRAVQDAEKMAIPVLLVSSRVSGQDQKNRLCRQPGQHPGGPHSDHHFRPVLLSRTARADSVSRLAFHDRFSADPDGHPGMAVSFRIPPG